MSDSFYIRQIKDTEAKKVIEELGFDKSYIKQALGKYQFKLIKIHNLSAAQANIVKQTALSCGADAATHREVIVNKVEKSDILLAGSVNQIKIICKKLERQPFKLSSIAKMINDKLEIKLSSLKIRETVFDWVKKSYIMGILNITPDSFSDGGSYLAVDKAVEQTEKMIEAGADIIDIGGESTRPFSKEVSPDEELKRIIPVIKKLREIDKNIVISVDTRHSVVAKEAIEAGADIINDVSGFDFDEKMLKTVAELGVPVVIMHSLAEPEKMQINPEYSENVVDSVFKNLYGKIERAIEAGIKKENIIIDPGIGFGKTLEHNLALIKRVSEFQSLGCPILMGVSRKSVISNVIDSLPEDRDDATLALNSYLIANGTNIIRVHNVEKHYKPLKVLNKIIKV